MDSDFSNALPPSLTPIEKSHVVGDVERELKQIFIDLFRDTLSAQVFDVNVAGVPHLGSFDLVRRSINVDGLVLIPGGENEEPATRYLYRAWKSQNAQGRGLHFMRTYLQMLFPNVCEVEQLWHRKDVAYPEGIVSLRDTPDVDTSDLWLTSRIRLSLDTGVNTNAVPNLLHIIRSVIPARLVPEFMFWLQIFISLGLKARYEGHVTISAVAETHWGGPVVTNNPYRGIRMGGSWRTVRMEGQPFSSIKGVGEKRFHGSHPRFWKRRSVSSDFSVAMEAETRPLFGSTPLAMPSPIVKNVRFGPYRFSEIRTLALTPVPGRIRTFNAASPLPMSAYKGFGTATVMVARKMRGFGTSRTVTLHPMALRFSDGWRFGDRRNGVQLDIT